jgi:hypothetical protein
MVAGGSPRQIDDLVTLARARFAGLTKAEFALLPAEPKARI